MSDRALDSFTSTTNSKFCDLRKSCKQCSESSESCHWCDSDFTCHAIGDWDDCWKRSNVCLSTQTCVRGSPEGIGLSTSRIMLLSLVGFFLLLIGLGVIYWFKKLNQQGQSNAFQERSENINQRKRNQPKQSPSYIYKNRIRFVICMTCFLILATVIECILAFFPKAPLIEICTGQAAWKSIWDNAIAFNLKANFQMLISMYNPNPMDLIIQKGSFGNFFYLGESFGVYHIEEEDIHLKALSITDHLVSVTFDPQDWLAIPMMSTYLLGTLRVSVDSKLDVMVPLLRNYTFTKLVKDDVVNLGNGFDLIDRGEKGNLGLCQCNLF